MKEALFYEKLEGKKVRCGLCAHRCIIADSKRGICCARENRGGVLYSLVYGKLITQQVDPVEKKPFFHFLPCSKSYSIATAGCNFRCDFCQNYSISQGIRDRNIILGETVSPEEIVESALDCGCKSISYTYTEPTIAFEYFFEIMKLAKSRGLYNNFVTNGFMTEDVLYRAKGYLDAANVDLKSGSDEFYKSLCGAKIEPVFNSLKVMKKMGIWVEVTTLIIPGMNDFERDLKTCAEFIFGLGKETPWHVSRFYPQYRLDKVVPTPFSLLEFARKLGLDTGLRYVYTGNVSGDKGENTYCYNCRKTVIKRCGFEVVEYNIKDSKCKFCSAHIDGVGL